MFESGLWESDREFFHFCYLVTDGHKDRDPKLHAMRDTGGAMWLGGEMNRHGYVFAGPIFNHAADPNGPRRPRMDKKRLRNRLRRGKVVLVTTRPALSDRKFGDRKQIRRSYTLLERIIFRKVVRPWLTECARSQILLTDRAAAVSPEVKKRQTIIFRQHGDPKIQACGAIEDTVKWEQPEDGSTVAFLLYLEELWNGGPAVVVAWAQDGPTTMVWCRKLATEFRHLLFSSPFVMAELRPGPPAPRAESIDFADAWETRILGVAKHAA